MADEQERELMSLLKKHQARQISFSAFVIMCALGIVWVLIFAWVIPTKAIDDWANLTIMPSMILLFFGFINIYYFSHILDKKRSTQEFVNSARKAGFSETQAKAFIEKIEIQLNYLKSK